ncbi:hypothetical protein CYL18_06315 [Pradoshia eiseniae]|uniref:Peptidase S8 n=1 Tax=Pradoshia eiseniae TaxID=2064768 RepID=A0A2S7N2F5_9BACI|nr:S8 family serine peptidase [Pradoshia eiseniae]PQD96209.1 hypothetical protein CYL18_06315 [Pradoshia eiseniae]
MKRLISLIVVLVFLFASPLAHLSSGHAVGNSVNPTLERVIVKMENFQGISRLLKAGATVLAKQDKLVTLKKPSNQSMTAFLKELESQPGVVYAEPDYTVTRKVIPNDERYAEQWHHQIIHSERAWESGLGSGQIVVAVIDDGIDAQHPDLKGNIVKPFNVLTSNSKVPVGEHGTHVGGIIAASANNGVGVSGVAPGAKIMPVNVFRGQLAYTSEIIRGIEYAVKNGADIINMSMGMEMYSKALNEAIQKAYNKGVLIVAAAGNDGIYTVNYPAGYNNVISVGATTQYDVMAKYSNYGRTVDILAPGTDILSTLPKGKYGTYSGTSMATPIVAGVAALIWSKEPKLTAEQVTHRILNKGKRLKNPRTGKYYDYPRVDAANVLKYRLLTSPKVADVTDKQTKISLAYSSGFQGNIYVTVNGKTITRAADYSSAFSLALDAGKMSAGSKVSVKLIDREGNESWPVTKTVKDVTPPNAPKVQQVADNSMTIKGTAEAAAVISIKNGKQTITCGAADKAGKYTLKLKSKQKAGSILMVTATDKAKNVSKATKVTVKDKTPPALKKISKITQTTTKITGKTEARAKVILEVGKKQLAKPVKADKNGQFAISIKKQKTGTVIKVILIDEAGNKSKGYNQKVLKK